jgi:fructoselysine 6-kinase
MTSLICVGDNTVDTYIDQELQFPGGNAVNVAAFAARQGACCAYLGTTAADRRGRLILSALETEGVDLSHCRVCPGETAWACVTHKDGDRIFLGSTSGVAKSLQLGSDDLRFIAEFDLVHSSIYSGLDSQIPTISHANPALSFDFSDDWNNDTLAAIAPAVHTAFLSVAEYSDNDCTTLARRIAELGPKVVVLTRGAAGATAYADGACHHVRGTPTTIVDTLGAGDGFIATFLLQRHQGAGLAIALRAAADYAAGVCRQAGGFGHGAAVPADELQAIRLALASSPDFALALPDQPKEK